VIDHLPITLASTPPWLIGLLLGLAFLVGGVLLVTLLVIGKSIRSVRRGAERLAQGDLSQRLEIRGPLQLSGLVHTLNQMARQLQDRLSTVVQQRNELTAVVSSMVEGVVAVDLEERILSVNPAAAEMLKLEVSQSIGRPIQEVIRHVQLQEFVTNALSQKQELSRQTEIVLRAGSRHGARVSSARRARSDADATGLVAHNDSGDFQASDAASKQALFSQPASGESADHYLQVQSAVLRDGTGQQLGVVVVFHDITRLRRLEQVRSDFVANVSHEVKTPVSAIKAAVETLLDDPGADPEDTQRFLKMVARQADRLDTIVEDLLSLARIEQGAEAIAAELQPEPVRNVLTAAIETTSARATEMNTTVEMRCDAKLCAMINEPLLEQALVNLIDNAIKYSPKGSNVEVEVLEQDQQVVIKVIDEGRGIEPDHLPRIFERFYRTDRARSRELGGTGLGLSIVKHVAEAHAGRVTVDSFPGSGSVFAIHLQAVPKDANQAGEVDEHPEQSNASASLPEVVVPHSVTPESAKGQVA